MKVEDINAAEMELSELVTHIRGDKGTTVHMQIAREGEADYLELDIERDKVEVPTVTSEMLDNHIGYIAITEFAEPTEEQFMQAVNSLKDQGMESVIIDLRDNPGGYLTAVTEILDDILPEGLTVYTEDKYGNRQNYTSDEEHKMDYPMAVLVNENSASASEIFSGAIQDYGTGKIVGVTTYGKGVVQQLLDLGDGTCFKVTIAEYYTPSGRSINKKGVEPDIEVEYQYDEADPKKDNQLDKALETVSEELK